MFVCKLRLDEEATNHHQHRLQNEENGTQELGKACVRASDAGHDARVTLDAKCDRAVHVEDDVATMAGEIAFIGKVGYDVVVWGVWGVGRKSRRY